MLLDLLLDTVLAALAILSSAPAGRVSPPDAMTWGACIAVSAQRSAVPWPRLAALVQHESQWRADARGATNDWGLAQIHCPGPYCGKRPTADERARLLDPCTNLDYAARLYVEKRNACRRHGGRACDDRGALRLYNPGNPGYASRVKGIERRMLALAR